MLKLHPVNRCEPTCKETHVCLFSDWCQIAILTDVYDMKLFIHRIPTFPTFTGFFNDTNKFNPYTAIRFL